MPTWETAEDWDSAQSESGVVHESVANTDHNDAGILKQGYSIANPYLSADLDGYWPLHEDSGETSHDFSGNNNDGTINGGVTLGVTGPLGTTGYSLNGTDGYISTSYQPTSYYPFTVSAWLYPTDDGSSSNGSPLQTRHDEEDEFGSYMQIYYGDITFGTRDGGNWISLSYTMPSINRWYFVVGVIDSDSIYLYVDGSLQDSTTWSTAETHSNFYIGKREQGGTENLYEGRVADARIHEYAFSSSEVQYLNSVVRGTIARGDNPTYTSSKKQL